MRLPLAAVESNADERNERATELSFPWLAVWLVLIAATVVGLIVVGSYLGRPKHHPELYGDYRGGYARGFEMRAAGTAKPDCETGLSGPYASPTTWPAIQARGIYIVGCRRGAKGKPIGNYVHRVDNLINND